MNLSSLAKIFSRSPAIYHFRVDFPLASPRIEYCLKKLNEANNKKPAAIAVTFNGITDRPEQAQTLYEAFYHSSDRLRIPVFTFLEQQATSLTYLAANSGTIIANPFCLIGQVGTSHKSYQNIKKLLDYLGVKIDWLGTHQQSIWNSFSQPTAGEQKFTQRWIETIEENMVKTVSYRRSIPIETLRSIKNKLFSPKQALEAGLIDEIGTFEEYRKTNFPNNPVKQVALTNKGWTNRGLQPRQIEVLSRLKEALEMPNVAMLSVQDPVLQSVKQIIAVIEKRISNPQSLAELDSYVGEILSEMQQQIQFESPIKLE